MAEAQAQRHGGSIATGSLHEIHAVEELEERNDLIETAPGRYEAHVISKTFSFKTYKDGLVFASAVGFVADKLNHHPDMAVGYAKVSISVNTHDVGGLSPYDFELARRIDCL